MSFEHRKYHGLYFILGFIIAAMLVMLLGCKPATSDSGVVCYKCEPPPPPQICWCDDWIYSDEIICYADIP